MDPLPASRVSTPRKKNETFSRDLFGMNSQLSGKGVHKRCCLSLEVPCDYVKDPELHTAVNLLNLIFREGLGVSRSRRQWQHPVPWLVEKERLREFKVGVLGIRVMMKWDLHWLICIPGAIPSGKGEPCNSSCLRKCQSHGRAGEASPGILIEPSGSWSWSQTPNIPRVTFPKTTV